MASKSIKKETIRWKDKAGDAREAERWVARYRDEAGRQHKKNFGRRVDAQRWLDETTAAIVTGRYVDPSAGKITFAAFYREWSRNQIWLSNSRENADLAVRCCTFEDLPLRKIRKSHVEAWVKHMSSTLAPTTIETRFVIVRSVLRAAVADKVIAEDSAHGVVLPRKQKAEAAMVIPTPQEVGLLIANADQTKRTSTRVGFRAYVALCAFAGLRRAEALGVQVNDIDFLRRQLRVSRQVQRAKPADIAAGMGIVEATGSTKVMVRPPKYGSERTVYLPDELIQILAEHIKRFTPDGEPTRWLFADNQGKPWHDNSVTWRWRGVRTATALGTRLHDLRHFYASGLIAAGCDVVTVQRALGHGSATTTLDTYSHLWPTAEDRTRDAASGMARQALAEGATGRMPGAKGTNGVHGIQQDKHA
ncbi:tyrosine-type recombinase/integrase [Leekyejoonella antrihumi]|uniref:Site-specific integrase n=1 Tax=Leekyejoonella antrihumi TaxID=1660198 RepID=A0A563DTF3_9MICO|nr:site-specific integrase [Leekyejoonella antrihumi]TWP33537.1 site-specific integrase [Leekyejoonella antrihumi]